jgi:serine/threonine protein kinase
VGQGPQRAAASSRDRVIPFGKYLLLDRIAVGGMAEVYTAKSFGVEGFEKIIAIKRILPTMAEDEDFIRMFIDEAKIAGQLSHANIVPIYELGKIGDSHYIAMEYVWGKDLLQVMNRFRRMRRHMPPSMAAWIASKMCEALDYAHRKCDRNGQPLNIIHRDVSPQNVLISYEGQVKVIDFGIAKAAARTTKTQAGVLKGKFGYMSPEQVRGAPIDHRSDIFAVGTCLHEMLTGERLFVGESDFSTLEKVRNAEVVPPSTVVPDVPKELEQIVLKALARDVKDRWQSAGDMHEALQMFIAKEKPPFGTSKLAAWMRSAFAAEIAKEKARLDAFAKIGKPASVPPPPPSPASKPERPKLPPPPPPRMDAPRGPDLEHDDEEELDEIRGEATVISSSPFEDMLERGGTEGDDLEDLQGAPTQIFFSAEELEEGKPAEPAAVAAPQPSGAAMGGAPSVVVEHGAPAPHPASMPQNDVRDHGGGSFPAATASPIFSAPTPAGAPAFAAPPGGTAVPPNAAEVGAQQRSSGQETLELRALDVNKGRKGLVIAIGAGGALALAAIAALAFLAFGKGSGGTLEIRTFPAVPATVLLDGTDRGQAPLRLEHVPAGDHLVELRINGATVASQTVEVREGSVAMVQLVVSTPTAAVAATGAVPAVGAQPPATATATGVVAPTAVLSPPAPGSLVAAANAPVPAGNTGVVTAPPLPSTAAAASPIAASPSPPVAPPSAGATTAAPVPAAPPVAAPSAGAATAAPVPAAPPATTSAPRPAGSSAPSTSTSGRAIATAGSSSAPATAPAPAGPRRLTPEEAERLTSGGAPGGGGTARPSTRGGRGYLMIQTLPWARVFIDGRDTGQNTPVRQMPVPAGTHRIGLRTNDGRMHELTVDVPPGETVRIVRQL